MEYLVPGLGILSCGAPELLPIASIAKFIQNVRSYISNLFAVQRNIKTYGDNWAEAEHADS
jgi:hypothetical protein